MGLTTVLEDESGKAIETVEDPTNILHRLLPRHDDESFRFLGTIDWYGDTVFNHLQAPVFLDEWRRLSTKTSSPQEIALLRAIEVLGEKLASERHVYLKFYGD